MQRTAVVSSLLAVAGCAVELGDAAGDAPPVYSPAPIEAELEVEVDEPVETAVTSSELTADEPATGRACTHTNGGTYSHHGCSPSYQCFDGSWRVRASGATCACEEATGFRGCAPPVAPPPAPAPAPSGATCTHTNGGVYADGGCSASYQCVAGAWRVRASGAACTCEERGGFAGCAASGSGAPAPAPEPIPDPAPMPPLRSASESIGSPSSGRQDRSVRVPSGPSCGVADTGRRAYFGTEETVYWLRTGFDRVASERPGAARVQVRDVSVERGGVPSGAWPHASHESGRDADVTYYLRSCSAASGCPLADVSLADFDAAATWTLLEYWLRAGVVRYVFVDHALQRPLYEEARRRGATATELSRWMQYPRSAGTRAGVVRHIANHRNHLHVRFVCPRDDGRCVE
jgi:murein endopeptidase